MPILGSGPEGWTKVCGRESATSTLVGGIAISEAVSCINSGNSTRACAEAFRMLFNATGCTDCFDELTLAPARDEYCARQSLYQCGRDAIPAQPTCNKVLDQLDFFALNATNATNATSGRPRRLQTMEAQLSEPPQSPSASSDDMTGEHDWPTCSPGAKPRVQAVKIVWPLPPCMRANMHGHRGQSLANAL